MITIICPYCQKNLNEAVFVHDRWTEKSNGYEIVNRKWGVRCETCHVNLYLESETINEVEEDHESDF